MHDTFLLRKISESLEEICKGKEINKITRLEITVNFNSHVTKESLMQELNDTMSNFIHQDFNLQVHKKNIEELTACINIVEGE
jgi:phosphotransferase system IIB component